MHVASFAGIRSSIQPEEDGNYTAFLSGLDEFEKRYGSHEHQAVAQRVIKRALIGRATAA